jgi:AraC-like DNA-binding protein
MEFLTFTLQEAVVVKKLISFHYHELSKDFIFSGEAHDFWELCYIDKGEVQIFAYNRDFHLKQGDMMLHKPNMFHSIQTVNDAAPNAVNVCFYCVSPHMSFFEDKVFRLIEQERNILSEIVNEGLRTFEPRIDTTSPTEHTLLRKGETPFGSEQLIKIGFEKLLISLIRRYSLMETAHTLSSPAREKMEGELFADIRCYLQNSLSADFNLEELSNKFHIGKSHLKKLFKEKAGMGIKQYWNRLKIEQAKIMVRDEKYNMTQISEVLGYSSVHYFSRHFKNEIGMTPTEYAKTVKARAF